MFFLLKYVAWRSVLKCLELLKEKERMAGQENAFLPFIGTMQRTGEWMSCRLPVLPRSILSSILLAGEEGKVVYRLAHALQNFTAEMDILEEVKEHVDLSLFNNTPCLSTLFCSSVSLCCQTVYYW